MFRRANEWGMFQPLGLRSLQHRACLYADDLVLLICLRQQDLLTLWQILEIFQGASGLGYNLDNCQMASIRCMDDQWQLVASLFPCQQVEFPITYLGIPLSMGKLQRVVWQRLIDKVADKLSTWKGALMHCAGRLALIKSTLSAVPIYTPSALAYRHGCTRLLQRLSRLSCGRALTWCNPKNVWWPGIVCNARPSSVA
jgi:hypothetical protein